MTNRIPTPPEARTVIVGVDTHKHVHVAVAIDSWGIRLGDHAFVADSGGYEALVTWAETHGRIEAFGIEGTGSYGAGLARAVRRAGHHVVEVNRGDRRTRRAAGKSDTIDAEVAARCLLAGQSTAIPKTADGAVEMIRQLKITRDTAMKARTAAMNTLKQIIMQAPPFLREALHDLTDHGLLTRCAGLRPGPIDTPIASAKHTLRSRARRWMALAEEIALHDQHLARLTTATSPTLCEGFGVGAHTAAELLIIFGDNPPRPDSFGGRFREALRRLPHPGLVWDDHRSAPPQSRRPPTRQRDPLSSRHRPDAIPPTDPRLRRPTHRRWPDQTRHHPLPETLPRARDLPPRHDRLPRSSRDHPGRLKECLDI